MNTTYHHIRVTDQDGCLTGIKPVPCTTLPLWARDVAQEPATWAHRSDIPFFAPPIPFVVPPAPDSGVPFYSHNHCPAITWLPNGDLLACWFSTIREEGTEMTILASRLRAGRSAWDPASEFLKATDRNMTGSNVYYDQGTGILHHLNGMGMEKVEGWGDLVMLHRISQDNGVTWSTARPASSNARYQRRNQPIAGMVHTRDGTLLQLCDATDQAIGNSAMHVSRDHGATWTDAGGNMSGIHAAAAELADGRWLALGRGRDINGQISKSISNDRGKTWQYTAGGFPGIGAAQRFVLQQLSEGPLLLISFTGTRQDNTGMPFHDNKGKPFQGCGTFAALSDDDGQTWPVRKLLTPGDGVFEVGPYFGAKVKRPPFVKTTPTEGEREGYLAATQSPDGIIHLISSRLHYRFNLAWIREGGEGQSE